MGLEGASTPIQLMGLVVVGFILGKQFELDWLFPTSIIITLIIITLDITFKFIIPMFKKEENDTTNNKIK